ncbi:MAG: HAD family hydrolase [Actinomycetaceae bacterium]|nr:HAD family hydrolase [Actinomycetaceae bacterium]
MSQAPGLFVPPEFSGSLSAPLPRVISRSNGSPHTTPPLHAPQLVKGQSLRGAIIAFDIDGTLINHSGEIEKELVDGLRELQARGARIIVATGRSIPAVMPILDVLQLDHEWVVCSNGAVTVRVTRTHDAHSLFGAPDAPLHAHHQKEKRAPEKRSVPNTQHKEPSALFTLSTAMSYEVIDAVTFDPTQVIEILHRALPHALIGVEDIGRGFKVSQPFPEGELIGHEQVVGLEGLTQHPVSRVIMRAPDMDVEEFRQAVNKVRIESIPWDIGWTAWLDVAPPFTTKAAALQRLANSLNVIRSRCVAVGDGTNDETMIAWAGWGIAMGQAAARTQKRADTVTATIENNGALDVVRALLE